MEKPPAAQTRARVVLSGVQRRAVTGPGQPGYSLVGRQRRWESSSPPVLSSIQNTAPWELLRPNAISLYLWLMAVTVTSSTPPAQTPCTPLGSNLRLLETRQAA